MFDIIKTLPINILRKEEKPNSYLLTAENQSFSSQEPVQTDTHSNAQYWIMRISITIFTM